jgi:ribosomal protein S4
VQSWTRENLYNLWRRSLGELAKETDFKRTQKSLFQQRWIAKRLVRAYHGDFINEKIFKRWYLPSTLPDVRPRRGQTEDYTTQLNKWAKLPKAVDKDAKARRQEIDGEEQEELPPVGSLMFSEVERRIDVVIFRACLAHSVYDARRMVVHGQVLLNGKKVRYRCPSYHPTNKVAASKREHSPCTRRHGVCRPKGRFFPPSEDSKRGHILRRAGCRQAQR